MPRRNIEHSYKLIDKHYLVLWDAKDLPQVEKWQKRIRETHDEELINQFFQNLDRKWNDHRNLIIEPLQMGYVQDVLTFKGIAKMCRLVTKQDATTFTYMAVGTGGPADTNPMPFEQSLIAEQYHGDFANRGFFEASGSSIRFSVTFGSETITDEYNESLVRNTADDSDTGRITFVIASFFDNPISHDQGDTGFVTAGAVEFIPIADISQ